MPTTDTPGSLAGIRVLEVGGFMAAPFATLQLADLGADVVKVEKPEVGDPVRGAGPFLDGQSSPFVRLNRNKRSIALDLKSAEGGSVFRRLAAQADVLVENLRPGSMARLGLGYQDLVEVNPGLVYASASGWGQDGPLAALPGLDIMAQARAGLMSITGSPGGEPVKIGVPICDLVTGLYIALGVLAALRTREHTGRGQYIDVSLLESGVSFTIWEAGMYWATGEIGRPLGSAHQSTAPYQALRTKDGWVTVGAVTPKTWQGFCAALNLPGLASDGRYADAHDRHRLRDQLIPVIERATGQWTTTEVVARLDGAGVPCAPINDTGQVFNDEHLRHRGFFWDAPHPALGVVRQRGLPLGRAGLPRQGSAGMDRPMTSVGDADGGATPPLHHTTEGEIRVLLTSLTATRDLERAVTVGDQSLSRGELVEAATKLATGLPQSGPVAVSATPSLDTVIAVVGCLLAGATAVPIPPDSGPAEVRHLLGDSQAVAWIGAPRADVDLPAIQPRNATSGAPMRPTPCDDAPAVILYTSGTTGLPKGVELSGTTIAAGLDSLAEVWDWTPDDTLVHGLPLFHTHGLILGLLGALRVGSRFVHTLRPRPEAYAAARGTMYFGVPTVWSRIADAPDAAAALGHARLLVSGSAPLPVPLFRALEARIGSAPVERYGMTETMITLSTRALGERRPGWVGLPVPGARTRIVSEQSGDPVPADGEAIGRLEVQGPMLFDGYLGRPQDTAESWTDDGWFRTGDIAAHDAEGFHRIVGRESTDLIKSGGYRVGSGEVETTLLAHPAVDEVAVVGLPDADLGQRIVAFVVGDRALPGEGQALIDYVATQLSWHKRPREVIFLDALPRNAMGKIQKKLLQQR